LARLEASVMLPLSAAAMKYDSCRRVNFTAVLYRSPVTPKDGARPGDSARST
jgi:hypothetical protein